MPRPSGRSRASRSGLQTQGVYRTNKSPFSRNSELLSNLYYQLFKRLFSQMFRNLIKFCHPRLNSFLPHLTTAQCVRSMGGSIELMATLLLIIVYERLVWPRFSDCAYRVSSWIMPFCDNDRQSPAPRRQSACGRRECARTRSARVRWNLVPAHR